MSVPSWPADASAPSRAIRGLVLWRWSVLYPLAALLAAAVIILLLFDRPAVTRLSQENQLIENATVVLYGLAILWLLLGGNGYRFFRYQSALVLAVMAARELSFHKAFTTESITRTSYWVRSDAPLSEKLVAGLVTLFVVTVVLSYLRTNRHRLWRRLWEGRSDAVSIMAAMLLVPVSKILDSSSRVLRDSLGFPIPDDIGSVMKLFEEMLELGIPLILVWALWQATLSRRSLTA